MMWIWLAIVGLALITAALWWKRRPLLALGREIQAERARELFQLQRERLESDFERAAAASGKPRGLRWASCDWANDVAFARERRTGQLAALVGLTIQFEAIEGSDMEGLPAVGNLREASAVFFFHKGQWHTVGKALFNLGPSAALQHFQSLYEPVTIP
jgi:hypothetical protein